MAKPNEYVEEMFLLLTKPANKLTYSERAAISTALYALELKAVNTAYELCRKQATAIFLEEQAKMAEKYSKEVTAAGKARDECLKDLPGTLNVNTFPSEVFCRGFYVDGYCYTFTPESPESDACLIAYGTAMKAAKARMEAASIANKIKVNEAYAACEKLNKPVNPIVRPIKPIRGD